MSIDDIITQLNDYQSSHDSSATSGPAVSNIWQDLILTFPGYDETLTDSHDSGRNDRFVVWVDRDAHVIAYAFEREQWFDSMLAH